MVLSNRRGNEALTPFYLSYFLLSELLLLLLLPLSLLPLPELLSLLLPELPWSDELLLGLDCELELLPVPPTPDSACTP